MRLPSQPTHCLTMAGTGISFEVISDLCRDPGSQFMPLRTLDGACDALMPVVVLTNSPVHELAKNLSDAVTVDGALRIWRMWGEALLRLLRETRTTVTVVDIDLLHQVGSPNWNNLAGHLGVTLPIQSGSVPSSPVEAQLVVLAEALLGRDPEAAELAAELRAAMFCAEDAFDRMAAYDRGLATIRAHREELRLQRETLGLMLSQIERLSRGNVSNLQRLNREIASKKTLEAMRKHREAELTSQIDSLYASRSWRITAPMRKIRMAFLK